MTDWLARSSVRYSVDPVTGCWLWLGAKSERGYGFVRYRGKQWRAHRAFYTELVGAIPDGLTLDHLCRTPSCVNPSHLEAVTSGVNILRGEGWAAINSRKTICRNGHLYDDENTRLIVRPDGTERRCKVCERKANTLNNQRTGARRVREYRARKRANRGH